MSVVYAQKNCSLLFLARSQVIAQERFLAGRPYRPGLLTTAGRRRSQALSSTFFNRFPASVGVLAIIGTSLYRRSRAPNNLTPSRSSSLLPNRSPPSLPQPSGRRAGAPTPLRLLSVQLPPLGLWGMTTKSPRGVSPLPSILSPSVEALPAVSSPPPAIVEDALVEVEHRGITRGSTFSKLQRAVQRHRERMNSHEMSISSLVLKRKALTKKFVLFVDEEK